MRVKKMMMRKGQMMTSVNKGRMEWEFSCKLQGGMIFCLTLRKEGRNIGCA